MPLNKYKKNKMGGYLFFVAKNYSYTYIYMYRAAGRNLTLREQDGKRANKVIHEAESCPGGTVSQKPEPF